MLPLWPSVAKAIADLTVEVANLEAAKECLYFSDLQKDEQIFRSEYCHECRGFCASRINQLTHLRLLSTRLTLLTQIINDILSSKCIPIPFTLRQQLVQDPPPPPPPPTPPIEPQASPRTPGIASPLSYYSPYQSENSNFDV